MQRIQLQQKTHLQQQLLIQLRRIKLIPPPQKILQRQQPLLLTRRLHIKQILQLLKIHPRLHKLIQPQHTTRYLPMLKILVLPLRLIQLKQLQYRLTRQQLKILAPPLRLTPQLHMQPIRLQLKVLLLLQPQILLLPRIMILSSRTRLIRRNLQQLVERQTTIPFLHTLRIRAQPQRLTLPEQQLSQQTPPQQKAPLLLQLQTLLRIMIRYSHMLLILPNLQKPLELRRYLPILQQLKTRVLPLKNQQQQAMILSLLMLKILVPQQYYQQTQLLLKIQVLQQRLILAPVQQ